MNKTIFGFLFLLLFTACSVSVSAQQEYSTKSKKAIKYFKEGLDYYNFRKDQVAEPLMKKALGADPNFIEPRLVLAGIYIDRGELEKAVKQYLKVQEINPTFHPESLYNLAKLEYKMSKYDDALIHIQIYNENTKKVPQIVEKANRLEDAIKLAQILKANPVPFDPKNLGENVNSTESEYLPTITADENILIITRAIINEDQYGTQRLEEDFFIAMAENGKWGKAKNMGPPINTLGNEGAQSISPDGRYLFFTACGRVDGKGSCDLYGAYRLGNNWSRPKNLETVNSSKWDSQPSLSSDGKTLYFTSARSGGKGGTDIWKSILGEDNRWGKPVNVEELNTPGNEISPFIHPDGKTIYFSSDGHLGMGDKDIFYARINDDGIFGTPINIGYPINTGAEESSLIVSADGLTAFFAANKEGGFGKMDLYSFDLYPEARPTKVTYVKGTVSDALTNDRLRASFELLDLTTGDVVVSSTSDKKTGEFLICLPTNGNYALNVSKEGYLFYSENFSLKDQNSSEPYFMDVLMQQISSNRVVVLNNIFFETGKYELQKESFVELDKLAKFMETNSEMKIEIRGHTDNVGSSSANKTLSQNRAKAVVNFLVNKGFSIDRLTSVGFGDTKPVEKNDTEEGRAKNRRTEFRILK